MGINNSQHTDEPKISTRLEEVNDDDGNKNDEDKDDDDYNIELDNDNSNEEVDFDDNIMIRFPTRKTFFDVKDIETLDFLNILGSIQRQTLLTSNLEIAHNESVRKRCRTCGDIYDSRFNNQSSSCPIASATELMTSMNSDFDLSSSISSIIASPTADLDVYSFWLKIFALQPHIIDFMTPSGNFSTIYGHTFNKINNIQSKPRRKSNKKNTSSSSLSLSLEEEDHVLKSPWPNLRQVFHSSSNNYIAASPVVQITGPATPFHNYFHPLNFPALYSNNTTNNKALNGCDNSDGNSMEYLCDVTDINNNCNNTHSKNNESNNDFILSSRPCLENGVIRWKECSRNDTPLKRKLTAASVQSSSSSSFTSSNNNNQQQQQALHKNMINSSSSTFRPVPDAIVSLINKSIEKAIYSSSKSCCLDPSYYTISSKKKEQPSSSSYSSSSNSNNINSSSTSRTNNNVNNTSSDSAHNNVFETAAMGIKAININHNNNGMHTNSNNDENNNTSSSDSSSSSSSSARNKPELMDSYTLKEKKRELVRVMGRHVEGVADALLDKMFTYFAPLSAVLRQDPESAVLVDELDERQRTTSGSGAGGSDQYNSNESRHETPQQPTATRQRAPKQFSGQRSHKRSEMRDYIVTRREALEQQSLLLPVIKTPGILEQSSSSVCSLSNSQLQSLSECHTHSQKYSHLLEVPEGLGSGYIEKEYEKIQQSNIANDNAASSSSSSSTNQFNWEHILFAIQHMAATAAGTCTTDPHIDVRIPPRQDFSQSLPSLHITSDVLRRTQYRLMNLFGQASLNSLNRETCFQHLQSQRQQQVSTEERVKDQWKRNMKGLTQSEIRMKRPYHKRVKLSAVMTDENSRNNKMDKKNVEVEEDEVNEDEVNLNTKITSILNNEKSKNIDSNQSDDDDDDDTSDETD